MLNKNGLEVLLGVHPSPDAPAVVLFSHDISPRLRHACSFIFNTALRVNFSIETDRDNFLAFPGCRINYSKDLMPGTLQVVPRTLLFEEGLKNERPDVSFEGNAFFMYKNEEGFPCDIFAAVFYMISRMEEWQNYTSDQHGRFEADQSILFRHGAHLKPWVDKWILELQQAIARQFPDFKFPGRKFLPLSTIDVDNLFAYKHKGVMRTLGAFAKDLVRADLANVRQRLLVLAGKRPDPFDVYDALGDFCFEYKIPLIFFFLFRTGTSFDRTVDPGSEAYDQVFDSVRKNKAVIGLHPSYWSSSEENLLKKEVDAFSGKLKEPVIFSRQHYLRFDIRTTPRKLMSNGIAADFTMGFASRPGFRAGTSLPFRYYDLEKEEAAELLFVPFCAMDGAYTVYDKTEPGEAYKALRSLALEVKKTNGIFTTVFHERTFSDHLYKGFGTLYKKLLSDLKE